MSGSFQVNIFFSVQGFLGRVHSVASAGDVGLRGGLVQVTWRNQSPKCDRLRQCPEVVLRRILRPRVSSVEKCVTIHR